MPDVERRHVAWQVALAATVVVNTVVMWSDGVAAWWAERVGGDTAGGSVLPAPLRWLFEARPDLGDAELHAVAWAVTAFIAVMVARPVAGRRAPERRRIGLSAVSVWAAASVWAWSVMVEALQPVVSTSRVFDWVDVVGNTAGVVGGAVVASRWRRRGPRPAGPSRGEGTKSPGSTPTRWSCSG